MDLLRRIQVTGFKSIREMDLELGPLTVLIGANGAGKSNLTSLFQMLGHAMRGNLRLFVAQRGRAKSFLHRGPKYTEQISLGLEYGAGQGTHHYHADLAYAAGDMLIFKDETVASRRGEQVQAEAPRSLGVGHGESLLGTKADDGDEMARFAYEMLSGWGFYQFHDTSLTAAMRQGCQINDNRSLRHDGGNLAPYLRLLRETQPGSYHRIIETVRLAAPFINDFDLEPLEDSPREVMLNWRSTSDDTAYGPHQLSDGTLRFTALTTLLSQPLERLPSLIAIDEPELGLHPHALGLLGAMVRATAEATQVVLATQSVALLDEFDARDIVVVEQHRGESTFERLDPDRLAGWLQNYSVSELWEKNVIGGGPRR